MPQSTLCKYYSNLYLEKVCCAVPILYNCLPFLFFVNICFIEWIIYKNI